MPKDTSSLDLAIAVAILQADNQIKDRVDNSVFLGKLGLDGSVRPVRGIQGKLLCPTSLQADRVFIPIDNLEQAKITDLKNIYPASNLKQLVRFLNHNETLAPVDILETHIAEALQYRPRQQIYLR